MHTSLAAVTAAALIAVSATAAVDAPTAARSAAHTGGPRYRHLALPTRPCREQDSPGPCVWDAGLRGNGHGASFWRDARGHVHYLDHRRDLKQGWHPPYSRCHYDSSQPEPRACQYPFTFFGRWRRVSSPMSDALAEGEYGPDRDWTRCIELVGGTTYIVCPDGYRITS